MTCYMNMLPYEVQERVFSYLNGGDLEACLVIWPHIAMFEILWCNALRFDGHSVSKNYFHAPENYSWRSLWEALDTSWKQVDCDLMSNYKEFNSGMLVAPSISKHAFVALTSQNFRQQVFIIALCCDAPNLPVRHVSTHCFFDRTCLSETYALAYSSSASTTTSILVALEKLSNPNKIDLRIVPGGHKREVQLTSSYIVEAVANNLGSFEIWCLPLHSLKDPFTLSMDGVMQPSLHVVASKDIFVVVDRTCGIQVLNASAASQKERNPFVLADAPLTLLHCSEAGLMYSSNSSIQLYWQPISFNGCNSWPSKCEIQLEKPFLPHNARLNVKTFEVIPHDSRAPLLAFVDQEHPWRLTLRPASSQSNVLSNLMLHDFQGFLYAGNDRLLLVGEERFFLLNTRERRIQGIDKTAAEPSMMSLRDMYCNSRLLVILNKNYSILVYDVLQKSFVDLLKQE